VGGILYIVTILEDVKIGHIMFSFSNTESHELIKRKKQSRLFPLHLGWLEESSRWLSWPHNRCQVYVVWNRKWMLYARMETMKTTILLQLSVTRLRHLLSSSLFSLEKWITICVKGLYISLLEESVCSFTTKLIGIDTFLSFLYVLVQCLGKILTVYSSLC
jgi:hypothetical protein